MFHTLLSYMIHTNFEVEKNLQRFKKPMNTCARSIKRWFRSSIYSLDIDFLGTKGLENVLRKNVEERKQFGPHVPE